MLAAYPSKVRRPQDPKNKRLYISYTDFTETVDYTTFTFTAYNAIDLAACDLDNPMAPMCSNGTSTAKPYLRVQPTDSHGCEQEGAYPAVRASTGDVYVGYEYNWATNFLGGPCTDSEPTLVVVKDIPKACLPDPDSGISSCNGPFPENSNIIISVDATPKLTSASIEMCMQSAPKRVDLLINGTPARVAAGTTVAAALLISGETRFRMSVSGEPRGPLCGMGICFECRVTIDGIAHCRSCQILCRNGMDVRTT